MQGWLVASAPARRRVKLVGQLNIEWLDEIHTADSMHDAHPATFSFTRAYFEASEAIVLFLPPAFRKQVRHISRFVIACATSRTEETTMAVVL